MLQSIKKIILFILQNIPTKHVTANIVTIPHNRLLENKTALITGGSSGIGYAIAEAFLKSGAIVIITGRNIDKMEKAKKDLLEIENSKNRIYTLVLDNGDIQKFEAKINSLIEKIKRIDILVNNAGLIGGNLFHTDEKDYDKIMDTNLKGTFFLSEIIAKHMINNKISGNILNICSSSSVRPANSAYTLSKWGIRGFTLGLAKSLIKYGITVNGIAPGPTATPMLNINSDSSIEHKTNPLGRMIHPKEIANMAVILTSDMGKSIVGDIIYMTGGAGLITFDDIKY